jgi:hypothetical protein
MYCHDRSNNIKGYKRQTISHTVSRSYHFCCIESQTCLQIKQTIPKNPIQPVNEPNKQTSQTNKQTNKRTNKQTNEQTTKQPTKQINKQTKQTPNSIANRCKDVLWCGDFLTGSASAPLEEALE